MSSIKLVATDMDGTLLNTEHQLPKDFFGIFEILCKRNILFVAASGRQYYNLLHVFEKIANRMAFIAENGTLVVYKGKEISSTTILSETVLEVIDIIADIPNAGIVICGKTAAYYSSDDANFLYNIGMYYGRQQKVDDLKNYTQDCLKIAIFCSSGTEEHVYPHVQNLTAKGLQVVVSGKVWLDMMPQGTNKGTALAALQQLLKISTEETAVFGDYMNDIEMMQQAKYNYAMVNAHPEVKKVANYITQYSNDEEGVMQELKQLLQL